jgi:hypothetical protein
MTFDNFNYYGNVLSAIVPYLSRRAGLYIIVSHNRLAVNPTESIPLFSTIEPGLLYSLLKLPCPVEFWNFTSQEVVSGLFR